MTNVLNDIAKTPLDSPTRYVDVIDKCNACGYERGSNDVPVHDDIYGPTQLGATFKSTICHRCTGKTTFTVTKVTPSKDQND